MVAVDERSLREKGREVVAYDPLSGRYPDFASASGALGAASPAAAPPPVAEKKPLDDADQRMKTFKNTMDRETATHEATVAKERADNQKIENDFFEKNPAPIFKPPAPYTPKQEDNPISLWGALAIGFAALASRFTRTPMTTALNAAGAALTAMKQGNDAAAKASYQQWKDANDQTFKLYEYQRDAYKDMVAGIKDRLKNNIDLSKEETADYRARIAAFATAFKDDTSLEMLKENSLEHWAKLQDQRDKNIDDLKEKAREFNKKIEGNIAEQGLKQDPDFKKMVESGDALGAAEKLAEANPSEKNLALVEKAKVDNKKAEEYDESQKHHAGQAVKEYENSEKYKTDSPEVRQDTIGKLYKPYSSASGSRLLPPLTSDNKDWHAKQLAFYQEPAPSQMQIAREAGWDGPGGAIQKAKEINPSFNPSKYKIVQNAIAKLETGKDSDAVASYTRLQQHTSTLRDLIANLPGDTDKDPGVLDRLAAAWGRQTGNENVTKFETAVEIVGDEAIKAVTGTGAAGALGDRESFKRNFTTGLDKKQLLGNLDALDTLVGGALVSTIDKARKAGVSPEELDTIFPPDMKDHYHVDKSGNKSNVTGKRTLGDKEYDPQTGQVTQKAGTEQADGGMKIGSAVNPKTGKEEKTYSANGKTVFGDGTATQ